MATRTVDVDRRDDSQLRNKPPFHIPPISYFVVGVPFAYLVYALGRWLNWFPGGHGFHVLYASISAAICLAAYLYGVGSLSPHAPPPPSPDKTEPRSRLKQAFSLPRRAVSYPLDRKLPKPSESEAATPPEAKP